ncbi:MAG: DUF3880 domain-containing protein [Desulfovibrio sp.]|jgi:hypothetical protein|nr:DUF3880 domain-containing protein [Desulfovibrio sp.]
MRCRIRLRDFAGRLVSLPDGPEAWTDDKRYWLRPTPGKAESAGILLLGLGPGRPEALPFTQGDHVFWLEEPRILRRLNAARPPGGIPANWQKVNVRQALELASCCRIREYRLNRRLAPQFWGPLMGRIAAKRAGMDKNPDRGAKDVVARRPAGRARNGKGRQGTVLLPGTDRQLLHQELVRSLHSAGFGVAEPPLWPGGGNPQHALTVWEEAIARHRPVLALSVNLRGLDPEGEIFWLCRALGIAVAVWCVDNPWHLLSSLPLPWWKEAALFVTDAGFIPSLQSAGARTVHHLPLAVAPHMWRKDSEVSCEHLPQTPLFVGHSAFPGQSRFFAAARVPQDMLAQAAREQAAAGGADSPANGPQFHWWLEKLRLSPWPGQAVRRAGLGADICSRARRARWISAALPAGLRLVGDAGWRNFFPGAEILPPMDYYAALPSRYARSAVLNVTSLLLPHSLSQRHFDVWAAGGVLLTDATPGLAIFPPELTRPVILERPEDFAPRFASLRAAPGTRRLCAQWRDVLRREHCYEHRAARICEAIGL